MSTTDTVSLGSATGFNIVETNTSQAAPPMVGLKKEEEIYELWRFK